VTLQATVNGHCSVSINFIDFWFAGQDDNQFRGSWWELKPRREV